jgi:hypothetical protein
VRGETRFYSWFFVLLFLSFVVVSLWLMLESSVLNKVVAGVMLVGWIGMLGLTLHQLWLTSLTLQLDDDGMRVKGCFFDLRFRWDSVDEVSRMCNTLGSGFLIRSGHRSVAVPYSFFEGRYQLEELIRKNLKESPMRLPFSWRPIFTPIGYLMLTASVFLILGLFVFKSGSPVVIGFIALTLILQFSLNAGQHELTDTDIRADQLPWKLRRVKLSSVKRAMLYENPNNGWETLVLVDENHTVRFKSQMTPNYFQVRDEVMLKVACPVERVKPNQ